MGKREAIVPLQPCWSTVSLHFLVYVLDPDYGYLSAHFAHVLLIIHQVGGRLGILSSKQLLGSWHR